MTWTLIGRADHGGLGQQTAELARHVTPDRALIVNPGGRRSRGQMDLARYDHVPDIRVFDGDLLDGATVEWVIGDGGTVFTVECWYSPQLVRAARRVGVRTVIQANPELLVDGVNSDLITLPTVWEAHRHPGAKLLPVPVNREVLPERPHSGRLRVLYHPAAPAMLDRNGTDLLLSSLRFCQTPFEVLIRGRGEAPDHPIGQSVVRWLPHVDDYHDAYPPEADALVLPRRYGGLSLSMQEAASLGLPIISLDLPPQRHWLDPAGLAEAIVDRQVGMRGGKFPVHGANPRLFARHLDELAARPNVIARMRDRSLAWADSLDWCRWTDAYRRLLT